MYPPPEVKTSNAELLGSTAGIILTGIVAVVCLAALIGAVFWADAHPDTRRLNVRRRGELAGSGPRGEISAGQGERPWERIEHRHVSEGGHPHGRPASWVLVAVVLAAFAVGGVAIIQHAWWLLWTCAGIVVAALPAAKLVGIMNDTVVWGSTPAATQDSGQDQEAEPGPDQPVPARK